MLTTPASYENYSDYLLEMDDDSIAVLPLVIYSVTFLVGISGNALVIWIATQEVRKTITMIWLLNLSVADFMFTALLPFSIVYQVEKFHWPFGSFMCKFISFGVHLNMFTSVFILTVTSIDRCLSVVFPVWCQNNRSVNSAIIVSLVVWVLAAVVSVPFYLIRDTEEDLIMGTTYCLYKQDLLNLRSLILARFTLGFALPFITIAICYTVITLKIKRRWRRVSTKQCKIITMIILAFLFCWIPFHILSIIHMLSDVDIKTWLPLATSFAYVYSCINPILYLFAGNGFVLQFKKRIQAALRAIHDEMSHSSSRSESRGGQGI
ncbi:chemokine-like receptor 1 [Callorhinchus milii]|uniref:chemokine-like receptor 1 n=1 Tax=Callorhinchus milii TaxID=7868 RepID=UPI001C3F8918|nr:chemokine-like receptor 1 [Callorhinchus milii]